MKKKKDNCILVDRVCVSPVISEPQWDLQRHSAGGPSGQDMTTPLGLPSPADLMFLNETDMTKKTINHSHFPH